MCGLRKTVLRFPIRLKKWNYPCIRYLILIIRYLRKIIRISSVSYPYLIRILFCI